MTATKTAISSEIDQKEALIEPVKVREGDFMQVVHFVKVERVFNHGAKLSVRNIHTGKDFTVDGYELVENMPSANQFSEEIELSRTKLLKIFKTCYNVPFMVCFDKSPDKKTGAIEERVLRGRYLREEEDFGRSYVEDIDKIGDPKDNPVRLVDHRTIKWLIVKGVKYVVKGA